MPGSVPTIGVKGAFIEALHLKSGLVGFGVISSLVLIVVVTPFFASYDVVRQWSGIGPWQDNPKWAAPEWSDAFSSKKEPRNTFFDPSSFRVVAVHRSTIVNGVPLNLTIINSTKKFIWTADNFPSELTADIIANFPGNDSKTPGQSPFIQIFWLRPDQQYVPLVARAVPGVEHNLTTTYHFSSSTGAARDVARNIQDWVIREGVISQSALANASIQPHVALFAKNDSAQLNASRSAHLLKGEYEFVVRYIGFGLNDTVQVKLKMYGTVFGLAGTDDRRRDLMVGILWGAPVALAFGVAAGAVVVLVQTILGALGGWYGGATDEVIQRATDIFLILPILPILIVISLFYRPGIWVILFVVVAFGIVGSTTKVVRSIVLQIREEQFIEAAQAYGASRLRILFRYIMPRVMPYVFALVALSVPAFIFLEASLSFLGLGDPTLPTWGALLGDAYNGSALFYGYWWWVAFPTIGIVYTAVGFALLGYAFDKVINPRLREE